MQANILAENIEDEGVKEKAGALPVNFPYMILISNTMEFLISYHTN